MTFVSKNTALCKGYNCNLRDNCYRYVTEPRYLQEFLTPPPVKDGKCDGFIDKDRVIMESDFDDHNLFLRRGDFND